MHRENQAVATHNTTWPTLYVQQFFTFLQCWTLENGNACDRSRSALWDVCRRNFLQAKTLDLRWRWSGKGRHLVMHTIMLQQFKGQSLSSTPLESVHKKPYQRRKQQESLPQLLSALSSLHEILQTSLLVDVYLSGLEWVYTQKTLYSCRRECSFWLRTLCIQHWAICVGNSS